MTSRPFALPLVAAGALAQGIGLVLDLRRHAGGGGAHEELLDLSVPAHAVLGLGLLLVATGVVAGLAGRARVAAVVATTAVALAGFGAARQAGETPAHAHADAASSETAAPSGHGGEHGGHDHGHGPSGTAPVDAATRAVLGGQLVAARDTASRFPTVADATAAGYRKITGYVPGIGAHYIRLDLLDAAFDVGQPEMLLYDGTAPASKIVGLSYYVRADAAPDGFAGPNDHWHRHLGLCIDPKRVLVVGGSDTTEAQCSARGGTKVPGTDGWMVHAWVVPGWESAQGVFSSEHPELR